MKFLSLVLATCVWAIPPPDTCDPSAIQDCLFRFEDKYASCEANDIHCQCTHTLQSGANCYAACPQEDMTRFIKTFGEGRCADFDPFLSRRAAKAPKKETEHEFESSVSQKSKNSTSPEPQPTSARVTDAQMRAITVTPHDPSVTISLSPQEYQSRLEKSRYKANLRSIRSERYQAASQADLPTEARGVIKHESSSTSTPHLATPTRAATSNIKEDKSGGARLQLPVSLLLILGLVGMLL